MRTLSCGFIFVFAAVLASADGLDGKTIALKTGSHASAYAPVSLSCTDTPPATAMIIAVQAGTEKACPVTVRNDELVFVPDNADASAQQMYTLKVANDKKPDRVQITKGEKPDTLDIVIDGQPFTTYYYSNDNMKPYLWPVLAEGGVHVTRDWPMGEKEISADHKHHKSMWTSYGNINGADCWMEEANAGFQHTDDITFGSGDAYGWIHSKNTWQDNTHKPVIAEEREYRFYYGVPKAKIFDVAVTFTAAYGDAKFGDTKEGGIMSLRIRDQINGEHNGVITLADGRQGQAACWGQPSPWCDYSGTIEGAGVFGATIMDYPKNLRAPSRWHVRDYGLMGANVFGLSHFTNKQENGDYLLKAGETLTFKYRVYVHSGDVKQGQVAERYADYTEPPTATWAEAKAKK